MQQLQIIVSDPCHEDWNEMTPNDQGKFCNSCAKTVVDFSAMTDAQLMNYFTKSKNENICGRVHSDQVQRTITQLPQARKRVFDYWQYALSMLLLLGKGQQSKAQSVGTNLQQSGKNINAYNKKLHKAPGSYAAQRIQIIDEKSEPIAGASLKFSSTGSYAFADSAGFVSVTKEQLFEDVTVSAISYNKQTIVLNNIADNKIILEPLAVQLEGVIVHANQNNNYVTGMAGGVGYIIVTKTFFKDTVQNLINRINPSISIYPNPVARGGMINLSLKLKDAGRYSVFITDASGKLLSAQDYIAAEKKSVRQIQIASQWTAGIYFVIVNDDKGKSIGKEKIVVM